MSSRPRLISVVLIVSFALVGCSGDSDPVSVATSVDTSLAPVSTSVPVPDSTVTTTAVPESTVPVTATATAPASSAPTSAPLSDEEQVIAAYEAAYDAFWAASQDPDNPEARRLLSEYYAGDRLVAVVQLLDRKVLDSERTVENPDVPHGFVIESVVVADGSATVVACVVNPWIQVRDLADGSQEVLNDDVSTTNDEDHLRIVDGVWKVTEAFRLSENKEGTCAV